MSKLFCCILLFLTTISCKQTFTGDILIENVTIIDVEVGNIIPNQDVVIIGNKISTILLHGNNSIKARCILHVLAAA